MNIEEYRIMFKAEDRHWWYIGLRGMLDLFWRRYAGPMERSRAGAPLTVLDAGCGTGAVLAWLSHRARPYGIDIAVEAIRFCRERGQDTSVIASTGALPFPRGHFDVAVSLDVLYHRSAADRAAAVREICSVLKPGGLFFVNLPAYQWLYSAHDVAVHTSHRFTRGEVLDLLCAGSFDPLAVTYWNTILFPPIVLVRLWRKIVPPGTSDLTASGRGVTNQVLSGVLGVERGLIRATPMPFGLSIFAVARKPA
jgi:SAM-dependent methyltransferase